MPKTPDNPILTDGSFSFDGGVDSVKVTTVKSPQNPDGLNRNQLAWCNNATVRDGGITQRAGWQPLTVIHDASALFQGGYMYEPDADNPYLVVSISGHILKVNPDTHVITDLSAAFGLFNPQTVDQSYFCQGEQFLVIQAGDGVTLPLFWDGVKLRRSNGLSGTPRELPAAYAMDYYQGRLWYAYSRTYTAGDIVGSHVSGTVAYAYRDSILRVTENPLALSGDGFALPSNAGSIRALKHSANLNAQLGQGQLFIGTRKNIYSLDVPVTRALWIAADQNNRPVQTVVQLVNGPVNDRSLVHVNGDLFYQSLEPGIRSLISAVRYFEQWGNVSNSAAIQRLMQFNNRALLRFASGIEFDNRMFQTALPSQTPQGVVHKALAVLDFMPVSTFPGSPSPFEGTMSPIWQGIYEGLDFMQLFSGDFGGLQRAFAVVRSEIDGSLNLWELTYADRFENGTNRVNWVIEFPAFTWSDPRDLKKLVAAELGVDRVFGEVVFNMEYRPDSYSCWLPWHKWKICSARNSCEDVANPICYPLPETGYAESYRQNMVLPAPPAVCAPMGRPSNVGYYFQTRLTIKGFCRIRSLLLHAEPVMKSLWQNIVC